MELHVERAFRLALGRSPTKREQQIALAYLARAGRERKDILTVGQYLRPSRDHLPIARFYTPEEFQYLKEEALRLGFRHVESGPLVRSSYHAFEQEEAAHS